MVIDLEPCDIHGCRGVGFVNEGELHDSLLALKGDAALDGDEVVFVILFVAIWIFHYACLDFVGLCLHGTQGVVEVLLDAVLAVLAEQHARLPRVVATGGVQVELYVLFRV